MRIRLVTLIGSHVDVLPFMLEHYREQGVSDFTINVHARNEDDRIIGDVKDVTTRFGCEVGSVFIGEWYRFVLSSWLSSMRQAPDDWWVLADQDELHHYPDRLSSLLTYCDEHGYDVIRGAFVDRIASDGSLPALAFNQPLWPQFPLGGWISSALLGASPLKIVAAKGRIAINLGHHEVRDASPCPITDIFAQVHHFKWTRGLVERLRERAEALRRRGMPHWMESKRFLDYYEGNDGRIDVSDPRLFVARCDPAYPNWDVITRMVCVWHPEMTIPVRAPFAREKDAESPLR